MYYLLKIKMIEHRIQIIIFQSRNKRLQCYVDGKYENIRKIATGKGDYYTTGCFLDYSYFKENYRMIEINLSKQQALDADPKAIQQSNFTANLERAANTTIFFIIEEEKETVLDFS